jgi:hypothetical protein
MMDIFIKNKDINNINKFFTKDYNKKYMIDILIERNDINNLNNLFTKDEYRKYIKEYLYEIKNTDILQKLEDNLRAKKIQKTIKP